MPLAICHSGRDVPPRFDELSAWDRKFIDVFYNNHNKSTFKPFHSVDEITNLNLELAGIQTLNFAPIDFYL